MLGVWYESRLCGVLAKRVTVALLLQYSLLGRAELQGSGEPGVGPV